MDQSRRRFIKLSLAGAVSTIALKLGVQSSVAGWEEPQILSFNHNRTELREKWGEDYERAAKQLAESARRTRDKIAANVYSNIGI
jgi:hypothetical protein